MMAPVMARIIFSLMDADGDGTVSLQEWQAAGLIKNATKLLRY